MLDREEYIEQAYFFRTLCERMKQNFSTQDLLGFLREEILATTKLPMAIDFMAAELRLHGAMAPAMAKLAHYFTPFQTFVIAEAENERGRFDFALALEILERLATYIAADAPTQGVFLYQFESLCRSRLGYDRGLEAMSQDPVYDEAWREWILTVRRQIGLVDLADLVYVRSEHYLRMRERQGRAADDEEIPKAILFGEKEGKIALAHRHKDPLLLFATLERQLGYPSVPRPRPPEDSNLMLPNLLRRIERVESRLRLLEEEGSKQGIDLTKFFGPSVEPPEPDDA